MGATVPFPSAVAFTAATGGADDAGFNTLAQVTRVGFLSFSLL